MQCNIFDNNSYRTTNREMQANAITAKFIHKDMPFLFYTLCMCIKC